VRRPATIITVLALCLLIGLAVWFYFWDGTVESRELRPGDAVTVGDTVAFTVPEGWEGFYDRYARVPSWVPLGAERPSIPFREFLTFRKANSGDSPEDLFLAHTYLGGYAPPGLAGLPRVAGSEDVTLFSGDRIMIAVVSGGPSPVYLSGSAQQDPVAATRRLWELLDVRGAESP